MTSTLLFTLLLSAVVYSEASLESCRNDMRRCVMPLISQLHGLSAEHIRDEILQNGLGRACSMIMPVMSCINNAVEDCGPHVPEAAQKAMRILNMFVNYVCVEEFEVINANRVCLASEELSRLILAQCGPPAVQSVEQICRLTEEGECGVAMLAEYCGEDIARVFRNFMIRLESEYGCENVFSFHHLVKMLL